MSGGVFKRFTVRDLILIAGLAALGIAIKPIVSPLGKLFSAPLLVPGGSFVGGLYLMWLVLAVVLVRKPFTGTLFGLVQAVLVLVVGLRGNQGLLTLLAYTLPGIFADLAYLALKRPAALGTHLILCPLANITGSLLVAIILFHHPPLYLAVILGMSLVSGLVGGFLSWGIYRALDRYGLAI